MAVLDGKKSIEFYKNIFGFNLSSEPAMDKGKVQHAEMKLGDCYIMFAPEGAYGNPAQTAATMEVSIITLMEPIHNHLNEANLNA